MERITNSRACNVSGFMTAAAAYRKIICSSKISKCCTRNYPTKWNISIRFECVIKSINILISLNWLLHVVVKGNIEPCLDYTGSSIQPEVSFDIVNI